MKSRRPDTLYLPDLEKQGKVRKWRDKLRFWKGDSSMRQKASYDDSSYMISISVTSSARSQSTNASKPPLPLSITSSSPSRKSETFLRKSFAADENSILQTSESSSASSQIPYSNRLPGAGVASVQSLASKFSSELSALLAAAADAVDGISVTHASLEDPFANVHDTAASSGGDRSVQSLSTVAQNVEEVEIDCTISQSNAGTELYSVDNMYAQADRKLKTMFSREASTEKNLRFVIPKHKKTEEASLRSRAQSEDFWTIDEDLLSREDGTFTEEVLDRVTYYLSCLSAMQEMERKMTADVCFDDGASETSDETSAFSLESYDSFSTHTDDDNTTLSCQYEIVEASSSNEIRSYSSRCSSSQRRSDNFWEKFVAKSDGYESSDLSDGLLHSDGSHIYMIMTEKRQKESSQMIDSDSGEGEKEVKKNIVFPNSVSAFDDITDSSKQSSKHDGRVCKNKEEVLDNATTRSQREIFENICEKASCSLGCSTSGKIEADDAVASNSGQEKWLDLVKSEILKNDYNLNANEGDRSTGTRQTLPSSVQGGEESTRNVKKSRSQSSRSKKRLCLEGW